MRYLRSCLAHPVHAINARNFRAGKLSRRVKKAPKKLHSIAVAKLRIRKSPKWRAAQRERKRINTQRSRAANKDFPWAKSKANCSRSWFFGQHRPPGTAAVIKTARQVAAKRRRIVVNLHSCRHRSVAASAARSVLDNVAAKHGTVMYIPSGSKPITAFRFGNVVYWEARRKPLDHRVYIHLIDQRTMKPYTVDGDCCFIECAANDSVVKSSQQSTQQSQQNSQDWANEEYNRTKPRRKHRLI